jgi:hypothetical protein
MWIHTISIFALLSLVFLIGALVGGTLVSLAFADLLEERKSEPVKPDPQECRGVSVLRSLYEIRADQEQLIQRARQDAARRSMPN